MDHFVEYIKLLSETLFDVDWRVANEDTEMNILKAAQVHQHFLKNFPAYKETLARELEELVKGADRVFSKADDASTSTYASCSYCGGPVENLRMEPKYKNYPRYWQADCPACEKVVTLDRVKNE